MKTYTKTEILEMDRRLRVHLVRNCLLSQVEVDEAMDLASSFGKNNIEGLHFERIQAKQPGVG